MGSHVFTACGPRRLLFAFTPRSPSFASVACLPQAPGPMVGPFRHLTVTFSSLVPVLRLNQASLRDRLLPQLTFSVALRIEHHYCSCFSDEETEM